jgi:soluble lytic murein transglycosylase-like protein
MVKQALVAALASALSALSAAAAVDVSFKGGRVLRAEGIEFRDGLAIVALAGGGVLAVEADRVASVVEAAPEPSSGPDAPPPPVSAAGEAGPVPAPSAPAPPEGPPDLAAVVREAALRHGVDAELLRCLIEVESGYDPYALSPKGAMGLAQLMPGTAIDLGVTDPFDPVQAADAAARHLARLLDRNEGRFVPALAAYNAGEGAAARWGGLPPYRETIRYVEKILSRYGRPRP